MRSALHLTALLALLTACPARAGETLPPQNLLPNPDLATSSSSAPTGWSAWSPRPALAATTTVDGKNLRITCDRPEQYGAWATEVPNIHPGQYYRFEVRHRAKNVVSEDVSVAVILTWRRAKKDLQRDYVDSVSTDPQGWTTDARTLRAPENASSLWIELVLKFAPKGTVDFTAPSLTQVPAPAPRKVRIITTHLQPSQPPSIEGNTRIMERMLDKLAPEQPDVVLFSENFVDRFVAVPFIEKSQPVPGPLTEMLSRKAKQLHTYVVTTLHELDQGIVYNTAVLIDREGKIAGKYHKVHIALAESEGGITPGNEFPVFQTDFGKVGILTCWDNWFTEPSRILRLKGAEILLFPLAGDGTPNHYEAVCRTRAMDNGLYLVSCPTLNDVPALIFNPNGDLLAHTTGPFNYAVADIDLNQEWRVPYLSVANGTGEAKSLYIKERRPDTYSELTNPKR